MWRHSFSYFPFSIKSNLRTIITQIHTTRSYQFQFSYTKNKQGHSSSENPKDDQQSARPSSPALRNLMKRTTFQDSQKGCNRCKGRLVQEFQQKFWRKYINCLTRFWRQYFLSKRKWNYDLNNKDLESLIDKIKNKTQKFKTVLLPLKIPKKVFVLDLDKTLASSTFNKSPRFDFDSQFKMHGRNMRVQPMRRFDLEVFLYEMEQQFEIFIFTSMQQRAHLQGPTEDRSRRTHLPSIISIGQNHSQQQYFSQKYRRPWKRPSQHHPSRRKHYLNEEQSHFQHAPARQSLFDPNFQGSPKGEETTPFSLFPQIHTQTLKSDPNQRNQGCFEPQKITQILLNNNHLSHTLVILRVFPRKPAAIFKRNPVSTLKTKRRTSNRKRRPQQPI